jgi:RNA polymerase sigma factor (sigma-70 family)
MTTVERPARAPGLLPTVPAPAVRWPAHLQMLLRRMRSAPDPSVHDQAMGEAWVLLNALISLRLRIQATRVGTVAREDAEDIAAQKSLDLLRRAESGEWDPEDRKPAELAAFLMAVARNGLVDFLRRSGRLEVMVEETGQIEGASEGPRVSSAPPGEGTDAAVERREFAAALRACAELLDPRTRVVWFLRAFCDLSTREIAAHPNVRLKPGHVDVLLHRARRVIKTCMRSRGHETHDIPSGTFAELWQFFRVDEVWRP